MAGTTHNHRIPQPPHLVWRTSLLDACWPRVRVESAHLTPGATSACASVVVQLGGLTPADVRVEMMPSAPASGIFAERRLFSSHALGNGSFVFETTLPPSDAAPTSEWLIHVHPSEAINEPMVEYRLRSNAS